KLHRRAERAGLGEDDGNSDAWNPGEGLPGRLRYLRAGSVEAAGTGDHAQGSGEPVAGEENRAAGEVAGVPLLPGGRGRNQPGSLGGEGWDRAVSPVISPSLCGLSSSFRFPDSSFESAAARYTWAAGHTRASVPTWGGETAACVLCASGCRPNGR